MSAAKTASMMRVKIMMLRILGNDPHNETKQNILLTNAAVDKELESNFFRLQKAITSYCLKTLYFHAIPPFK